MKIQQLKKYLRIFVCLLALAFVYSCANLGTPNGGPYDEDPPKFVSSSPMPNQTNFKGKKVEILFDELIQIDRPTENVIVTPPQILLPIIRAQGKRAVVELKDSLKENTTYTIDFTNSIADSNEKNVFENFSFAFSTGDVIDSLEVSGFLLNAENLEPMSGITIGLHSNLDDSAFVKIPFIRTSRTNERGKFVIRNIAPGKYHIFALNDVNRDYKFDQPGEDIAFSDSIIVPEFEFTSRQDTMWRDSLTIDTIKTVHYTRFMPDNIELRLFKEKFQRQYIVGRLARSQRNQLTLRFNAPLDTVPIPVPLNFKPESDDWIYPQVTEGGQAVNYWLTDPSVLEQDTLQLEFTYSKSDSLNILRPQTDTLTAAVNKRLELQEQERAEKERKKRKKKDDDEPEAEPIVFLGMTIKASGSMNVFDTISIVFEEPVIGLRKELFYLDQMVDSVWTPVEFDFYPDSTNSLGFFIQRPWRYTEEYRLEVDSATITSIYGKWNNTVSQTFKTKQEEDYGHLFINIQGVVDTIPAFVELLNANDAPVRKAAVKDGGVLFMNLNPDKYYVRLIVDVNNNGVWDTGNYAEKLSPETVIYCSRMFEVMKNWEVEETWNVEDASFTKQKPLDITKNKPKEVTKQKRDHRDEGRRSSGGSNNSMQMPGNMRF